MKEFYIGEIIVDEEVNIEDIELDVVNVYPKYDELLITPSNKEQVHEGSFNKVIVAGDINLIPNNIKEGKNIFGVQGTAKVTQVEITDASYLFHSGTRLDYLYDILALLSENLTNMYYMFYSCSKLTTLDLSNIATHNVRDMTSAFYGCQKLTDLNVSNFDTSNVEILSNTFNGCKILENLDLSSFDASNVTSISGVLLNMPKLTNFKSFKNLGRNYTRKTNNYVTYRLDLSTSPLLTHESLMDVINNLYDLNLSYDVANGGQLYRQSLILGSTNLAKLAQEEINIATNKGWDVS